MGDRFQASNKAIALGRLERGRQMKEEQNARARRGEDGPSVPANLAGKATPEEVASWVNYKPAKPPGRS